jgi:hypothetical protein
MARILLLALLWSAAAAAQTETVAPSGLRYDVDYPAIAYSATPRANEIARLQSRLDRGEIRLEFSTPRGYLDSLLKALQIDPSSQVLVYSKTSLQFRLIRGATPRAVYFNDDTYVAWVQGTEFLEIATMDSERGAVFYTLPNRRGDAPVVQRETNRCLSCHDTFSMTGGGVPRFLFLSAPVDTEGILLPREISIDTDDRTPLAQRWGGWYVTGQVGHEHRGNALLEFDTSPYLTDRSDVVALLVLEHQLYIKNLITRLNFKTRSLAASPRTKRSLQRLRDQLLEAMLFSHAAPLPAPVRGSSGFETAFTRLGPRDPSGRSLRDFDLQTRLFRYPLSYVIYSEGFDALPEPTRQDLYSRLYAVLRGEDTSGKFAHLTEADRKAILEILSATKPDFRNYKLGHAASSAPSSCIARTSWKRAARTRSHGSCAW